MLEKLWQIDEAKNFRKPEEALFYQNPKCVCVCVCREKGEGEQNLKFLIDKNQE